MSPKQKWLFTIRFIFLSYYIRTVNFRVQQVKEKQRDDFKNFDNLLIEFQNKIENSFEEAIKFILNNPKDLKLDIGQDKTNMMNIDLI